MDSFTQCVEKLTTLLNMGLITAQEFGSRRQKLVDEYVGKPQPGAAGAVPTAKAAALRQPLAVPRTTPGFPHTAVLPRAAAFPQQPAFPRPSVLPRASAVPQASFLPRASVVPRGPVFPRPGVPQFPTARPVVPLPRPQFPATFGQPVTGYAAPGPIRNFAPTGAAAPVLPARGAYTNPGGAHFSPYVPSRQGAKTAIKVQPVPDGVTSDELKATFSPFGQVVTAAVREGEPRHGYVNFTTTQEAFAAAANGFVFLRGQQCKVTPHWRPRPAVPEGEPTNGIGIFNLPFSMSQEEVQAILAEYPGFQTIKYVTNKMGVFRGYIFAYFDTVENATYAKAALSGLAIGDQVLDVKYSNRSAEEVFQDPAGVPFM